ncbi:hypothetical protein [Streptomyces sp. NPDC001594]|uniref:hypothetical protein n=1 Tax=Streptomyces sp. NPDC001594 TaxID=3364590 RepID=UPI003691B95B
MYECIRCEKTFGDGNPGDWEFFTCNQHWRLLDGKPCALRVVCADCGLEEGWLTCSNCLKERREWSEWMLEDVQYDARVQEIRRYAADRNSNFSLIEYCGRSGVGDWVALAATAQDNSACRQLLDDCAVEQREAEEFFRGLGDFEQARLDWEAYDDDSRNDLLILSERWGWAHRMRQFQDRCAFEVWYAALPRPKHVERTPLHWGKVIYEHGDRYYTICQNDEPPEWPGCAEEAGWCVIEIERKEFCFRLGSDSAPERLRVDLPDGSGHAYQDPRAGEDPPAPALVLEAPDDSGEKAPAPGPHTDHKPALASAVQQHQDPGVRSRPRAQPTEMSTEERELAVRSYSQFCLNHLPSDSDREVLVALLLTPQRFAAAVEAVRARRRLGYDTDNQPWKDYMRKWSKERKATIRAVMANQAIFETFCKVASRKWTEKERKAMAQLVRRGEAS